MSDLTPRSLSRPLYWPDIVYDLQEALSDYTQPVYLVGGAVRDAVMNRPIKDIDLVTASGGIRLARKIANKFGGDFFALDDERDVGRALVTTPDSRMVIDVTSFRGGDLLADLLDRDFTFNAMAVQLNGDLNALIDPLGGEKDATIKLLRRCSPDAISNDPVRALRAVRLSVQYGAHIERETLKDVRAVGPRIMETSAERVRDEFMRILGQTKPASGLRVLESLGLLRLIVPETESLHGRPHESPQSQDAWTHTLAVIEALADIAVAISPARTDDTAAQFSLGMMVIQLDRYRARLQAHLTAAWPDGRTHAALLTLAGLLHETATPAEADERATALRLSADEREHLARLIRNQNRLSEVTDLSPRTIYRFWRGLDAVGVDVCLLALADILGTMGVHLVQETWLEVIERVRVLLDAYYNEYDRLVQPPPLVKGNELIEALDLKAGPIIGELLEMIREAQAAGEVESAEDALRLARQYVSRDNHR
jgi:tRNA nucleotidyltransferase/poly(A) polymerase